MHCRARLPSDETSVLALLGNDVDIVDQARRAERRRAQHDQQMRMVESFRMRNPQADSMADRDVVDFPAMLGELGAAVRFEVRIVGASFGDLIRDGAQRSVEPWSLDAFYR